MNTIKKFKGRKKNEVPEYKNPLRQYHPSTSIFLAGYDPRFSEGSVKPPLFRTSTFQFSSAEEGEKFFQRAYHLPGNDGQEPGLVYSRLNNPNIEMFEDRMVAAEIGADNALAYPSGMSAITSMIIALVPSGGKILYGTPLYGGTYLFLQEFCPKRFDITTIPIDLRNLTKVKAELEKNSFNMVFFETPANPTMTLTDIGAIVQLTRQYSPEALIAIDNTFLGPVFQSPFLHGADLVVYSATKFIGGHSDLIAGLVLTKSDKHKKILFDYRTILGPVLSPDTAWMLTRSLETMWLRMERQAEKASKIASVLAFNKRIEKVLYPGLIQPKSASYLVYKKQCTGPGSILSFYIKDASREQAFKFLNALKICHLAVSLGGTETLIEHPRSMTHSDMTTADLDASGITENMVRLSVGLESSDDILKDLFQALEQ